MNESKQQQTVGLMIVLVALALGVWLLGRPVAPAAESGAHQQAVRQLLAPAGGPIWPLPEIVEHEPAAPVFVNLMDLPAASHSGIPQEAGEEEEGILGAELTAGLQTVALNQPPDQNVQLIGSGPASPVLSTTHFAGPDFTQCCGGFGGITPPDPEMAAGPDHLIVVVNLAFAIYDKAGTPLLGPLPLTSLFGSTPQCTDGLFDPAVLYDEAAGRFMITIDAEGSHFCVAVAQSSNPLIGWAVYAFDANGDTTLFFDYPQVGIGRDALYMSGNLFDTTVIPATYVSSRLWAFDKADLYSGLEAAVSERSAGSFFTPQPLNLHGEFPASGPHYFLGMHDFANGGYYGLIAWNEPFGSNTATYRYVNLNEAAGEPDYPISAPQLGGQNIQANDWRPLDFEYHNGDGWLSQTISCNPGTGVFNCVRWGQIALATGAVKQAGLFAGGNEHRLFPDLAVNACGDMAVGYTKTSGLLYPSIWYTGRQAGDLANTLQNEAELKEGEIPYVTTIVTDQPPYRWGDYTGMTIDPDGKTFWYVGEYSKNTGTLDGRWGTYVGAFSYPCSTEPVDFSSSVYLPFAVKNNQSFLPKAGYWQSPPSHDFYVRPDRTAVLNFGIAFSIPNCGDFKIILPGPFPIVNNRFDFQSVLYASGVFSSETTASGFDGINNLYIAQCDVTITAGPFAWNATWQNADQPIPTAQIVDDPLVQRIEPGTVGLIVIPQE